MEKLSTTILGKNVQIIQAKNSNQKNDSFSVRQKVFVEEQQVPPELEIDTYDQDNNTIHIVAYYHSAPVGSARLREFGEKRIGKVERVAVLKDARGLGIGCCIMRKLESIARISGYDKLTLNAQDHAQSFYERLGYQTVGDVFLEANIQHISMEKELD